MTRISALSINYTSYEESAKGIFFIFMDDRPKTYADGKEVWLFLMVTHCFRLQCQPRYSGKRQGPHWKWLPKRLHGKR